VFKNNIIFKKPRQELIQEGQQLKERIVGLGIPRMWGSVPEDILRDTTAWQEKCGKAGLSSAAAYDRLGTDTTHIGASEVLLIIDEALLALDPPGAIGG
jgi:hypothetical protein